MHYTTTMTRTALTCLTLIFTLFAHTTAAPEPAPAPIKHRFLLLDESRSQFNYVDQFNPANSWQLTVKDGPAWGLQLVGNNRALVALPKKGGFREYDLSTRKIVREHTNKKRYNNAISAIRLPDGRTVLVCDKSPARLFLFDPQDKEIASWEFPEIITPRQIRRTHRNTLLLGSGPNIINEISLEGKILRKLRLPGAKYIYQAIELPNGNLIASGGYGGFLAEIDKNGTLINRKGGRPEPKGLRYIFISQFHLLKNGNTIVATWTGHRRNDSNKGQQIVEFDPSGKVVWQWHDPAKVGSVHAVIATDDLDPTQFHDLTL
ncbi:MAG: hypothetical protein LBS59_09005 [Puniceicoccales bacterium]|jgi:hypothetical protein|nr:hypothetical protein [Puniceicoccales bacterium]